MKQSYITSCIIAFFLLLNLSSCLDHRLGGNLSPVRLRLKNIQGSSINTTYTYDTQNRLATITKADGSLGVFAYGDPDKKYVTSDSEKDFTYFIFYPKSTDQTVGEITQLPLTINGTNFQTNTYGLIFSKRYSGIKLRYATYTFDADKHISRVYRLTEGAPAGDTYEYTITNDNITGEFLSGFGGHNRSSYTYSFDSKLNPFYGLMDPNLKDIEVFSKNNVVTRQLLNSSNSPVVYEYEYNPQGLPTKRTTKQGGDVLDILSYTYESY